MLSISNLSKSYGDRQLFGTVSFTVGVGDRIALVGPNGSGKTTLFEIIIGKVTPDTGNIAMKKETAIGYLQQDIWFSSKKPLLEEVISASTKTADLTRRIKAIEKTLADAQGNAGLAKLLGELGELQHSYELIGGYDNEHTAKSILSGLGFVESDFQQSLDTFSGGWLMRAELAKLLLQKPDLLLLDEPTNHLDLDACIWFERYLERYQGAVLVTSHDRAFLNRVAGKVLAFEQNEFIFHRGNYNSFILAREKNLETKQVVAARQERKVKRQQRFIDRFRAKNTKAKQVQSRIKQLEKIERVVVPRSTRKIHFSFPAPVRSGKEVISLKHVFKAYDTNVVYRDLNLVLNRGDRVALVGPNGAGKTTLLKIMAGVVTFERGECKLGHNVITDYYAQYQLELLNPQNDLLTELRQVALTESEETLRRTLGAFLFSGDDVNKKISVLSGGEKARVALAKMLTQPTNFLLMDEPTNHLDIPSREILTDALEAYRGTLCFITHDRTLIQQIANKIIEIRNGQLQVFLGNYDSYLYQKETPSEDSKESLQTLRTVSIQKNQRHQQKQTEAELRNRLYRESSGLRNRITEIEAELSRLETRLKEAENQFADREHYQDSTRVVANINEHRSLQENIRLLTEEWERLSEESDRLESEYNQLKRSTENRQ